MIDHNFSHEEFGKCWACGSKVRKSRIENHHILGKNSSDSTVPLCILCHDLVDRITIDNVEVFDQYFLNCYNDLIRMGDEYRWTKIFLLKCFKLSYYNLFEKNSIKDFKNNEDKGDPTKEDKKNIKSLS